MAETEDAVATRKRAGMDLLEAMVGQIDRKYLQEHPEVIKAVEERLSVAIRDFRKVLSELPLDAMIETFGHVSAFGCFFDPTGWQRTYDVREDGEAIFRAASKFHHEVGKVIADRKKCRPVHSFIAKRFPCPICGLPCEGPPATPAASVPTDPTASGLTTDDGEE